MNKATGTKNVTTDRKGGRPRKSDLQKKSGMTIRLTKDERNFYRVGAEKYGIKTLAGFFKLAADELSEKNPRLSDEDRRDVFLLDNQLRIIGRNLNLSAAQLSLLIQVPQLANEWQAKMGLSADELIEKLNGSLHQLLRLGDQMEIILARMQNNLESKP